MRIGTKERFAVNAMVDLALRGQHGPVALAGIAARQQVSLSYLEQLFSRLRRSGIVQSTRGPGGGYTLARSAADVSVADIVTAVVDTSQDPRGADPRGPHLSSSLWDDVQQVMLRHLATVPLKSLVDAQRDGNSDSEPRPARAPAAGSAAAPLPRRVRTTAPNSVFAFGDSFAG